VHIAHQKFLLNLPNRNYTMKQFILSIPILIVAFTSNSQQTKRTWLVGGTGGFSSMKNTYSSNTYYQSSDVIDIKISPNIGFFIMDKFGLGIRASFSKYKAEVTTPGGGFTNVNRFELGPFARYYFLEKESQYNLLSEVCYQYGIYRFKPDKGNINTFSVLAGPVVYFNTVVGLEFLIGYYKRTEDVNNSFKTGQKGFQITIGLQVHLQNE
jgi:hypothetical protein